MCIVLMLSSFVLKPRYMKNLFTFLSILFLINGMAQLPVSIYETPSSGNTMNRFEYDNNYLYVVRDSSVDKIDAYTSTVTKLFNKPWGASLNASGKAIFSNGKSIIGQYITGSPYRYKYWVYDGTAFDTLFSLVNTQIDNWVTDGNVCYFYVAANKKLYKSDFTKSGTLPIAVLPSNTLLVNMKLFNHDLYFFDTNSGTSHSVLKKYAGNTLSVIDSSANYAFDDIKMQVYNNNFYYAHYQLSSVPSARFSTKIVKISASGTASILYSDTTASGIYVKGFMGGLSSQILLDASISISSNEYVYLQNTSVGTPVLLQTSTGASLNPQSVTAFKQAGSLIYINSYDPANSSSGNRDLWQTDGTPSGTRMVTAPTATNIVHTAGYSLGNVDQWCLRGVTCDNTFYSLLNTVELWSEDGINAPAKITVPDYTTFGSLSVSGNGIFMTSLNTTTYKRHIMKLNCTVSTGIKTTESKPGKLMIYPNPSNSIVYVKHDNLEKEHTELYIYSVLGEQLQVVTIDRSKDVSEINIEQLASGTYVLTTNKGYNQLLIKQ